MSTHTRTSPRQPQPGYKGLLQLLETSAAFGQSYETLMSSLRLLNGTRPLKTLLFTSAQPGEGKTTVAVGLALTMARAGKRTLIIDADLRRPKLHRLLEVEDSEGLADLVAGTAQSGAVVRVIDLLASANAAACTLSVVTSGRPSAGGATAIQSPSLGDVLRELAVPFDTVLIDSPPVLSVNDPVLLASLVDGVVLIMNTGAVTEADAKRAKQRLEQAGGRILGVVMNRFDEKTYGPGFHPYHAYYDVPKSRS